MNICTAPGVISGECSFQAIFHLEMRDNEPIPEFPIIDIGSGDVAYIAALIEPRTPCGVGGAGERVSAMWSP